ncbi:hypothetical protein BGW38_004362 [Lunasporangiospora selenospora]|uniref:Uncharacterized protein n=1 Tax=Lunasporangiospora selenospora TaxID=979761 RepID=A0A9P6KIQ5_9FUNG|nr:hypothetical protein BGW38_004362 [Lunasporangiospora selenospora]
MQELWEEEQATLMNYSKEQEPLRKLRTRSIIAAAKDSSKLPMAVGRLQLHQALTELWQNQEQEQEQEQEHQQKQQQTKRTFIEQCFEGEKEIVAQLARIDDVPEAPCGEVNLIIKYALAAAVKEYVDFKSMSSCSSQEQHGLAGDSLSTYTATNALWQDQAPLAQNKDISAG